MSDINLLVFGCAVTFIGFGGAYIYLREVYDAHQESSEPDGEASRPKVRGAA